MIQLQMSEIRKIETLAQNTPDCISFSQGTLMLGGVDKGIKKYAQQILETDKADYYGHALGIEPLRKKIKQVLSDQYGVRLSIDNIAVTHGALGALTGLFLTLLNVGDEVLLFEPTYPMYKNIIKSTKATPVFTHAFTQQRSQEGELNWQLNLNTVTQSITSKTKLMVLPNPSNPAGFALSSVQLNSLKQLAQSRGIYLICDEVYDDYLFQGEFNSITPYVLDNELFIRVGSFSKCFAMSGWRVGYVVASQKIIRALEPVLGSTYHCPNIIGQYAGLYALEHKKEIIASLKEKLFESRDIMCSFLDRLQDHGVIEYVAPQAGFFAFIKTRHENSFCLVMDILKKANVALVPGIDFGPNFAAYIRICFAREPRLVEQGVARLQNYFSIKQVAKSIEMLQPQI